MKRSEVMLHPVRLRILVALGGGPATAGELLQRLPEVSRATLYRQLARLEEESFIEVVSERQVRGVIERTYGRVPVSIPPDERASMTREDLERHFATYTALLMESFSRGIRRDPEPDQVTFRALEVSLTREECVALRERLLALSEPRAAVEGEEREAYLFGFQIFPSR